MNWKKQGLIFAPDGSNSWAKAYAGIPTAEVLDDRRIRIYYYSVDEKMDGRISFIDVDSNDPKKILHIENNPVLDIGQPGAFDDCGVCPSCVVRVGDKKYLYYLGVQRCEKVPYLYFAGLSMYNENQNQFIRILKTPVLERTNEEYFLRSATSVLYEKGSFRMWYVSGLRWIELSGKKIPEYVIRYAESKDGVDWQTHKKISIDFKDTDEHGFGRPWVISDKGIYKMWYSIRSRSKPYSIGYAESENGTDWIRKDEEAGIERSAEGWDSEMICYPCVIDAAGKRYMFYNGNRHGHSGFGYAVLE